MASYAFYFMSSANTIVFMIATTIVTYAGGLLTGVDFGILLGCCIL